MRLLFRLLRALAGVALALALLAVALAGALTWRLAQGPLDVTALAQRIAARYAPTAQTQRLTLEWGGFDGGPRSLHLVADDLRYGPMAAGRVAVALSLPRLLEGLVEPSDIVVDGLRLHATRRADGQMEVDGLPTNPGGGGSANLVEALRHVALHDAAVIVTDAASGKTLEVGGATVDLQRQSHGGVTGQADANLTLEGVNVTASLRAERDAGGTTRVQAAVSPVSPAALAHIAPALAPLAMLDAAVTLHGQAELGPDLGLRHAAVQAQAGEGTVQVPAKGGGVSPGHFASIQLDAEGDLSVVRLNALQVVLAPPSGAPPTTVTLSGSGRRADGRAQIQVAAAVDRLALADLPSLWPLHTGGGARPWLTENVTTGVVHDGHFTLTLTGPPDDLTLVQAGGSMQGEGVTLYWLRPVPPVEHGSAVLTLEGPDAMNIAFSGARQGRIVERAGSIRITGMSTPHQIGLITTDLAGPVADVVKLLSHPRLNLLSAHPLPLVNPSGSAAVHLTVRIPLEDHVEFNDVAIHANGQLTDLHLGGLVEGHDLDHGTIALDVTNDGLKATGGADLAGMPSTLQADMDFRDGNPAQVTQHIAVAIHADERQLAAAGLDTFRMLGGALAAKLDYAERRNGAASVQLDADVRETTFQTPLNWSKTAGTLGFVQARAELLHGRLVAVDRLRAEAPGLSIEGRSEVVDGRPVALHLDRAVVGRTSATGSIRFAQRPGDPMRVTLAGPRLDLTAVLEARSKLQPAAEATAREEAPGVPFAVDLRFGQVFVKHATIAAVALTAEGTTSRVARATLRSGGAEAVQATLAPAAGGRHLSVAVTDLGVLLRALDVTETLAGGRLALSGDFDDRVAGSPFAGSAELTDFRVQNAPILGKVLQALTLYGLVDALRGPGLVFDRLSLPFRLTGSRLELDDARAFSSSLGVTAKGALDLGRSTLAMDGTVVPAYALNTLPGRLPLLGRLFSPERGGGVFAATYNLHGALSDPRVGFNPLAALTPGALRGLFGMLP